MRWLALLLVVVLAVIGVVLWSTHRGAVPASLRPSFAEPAPEPRPDARLHVGSATESSARSDAAVVEGEEPAPTRAAVKGRCTLHVRVQDASGAELSLKNVDLRVSSPLQPQPIVVNLGGGHHVARDLAPGTWFVRLSANQVQECGGSIELSDESPEATLTLAPQPWHWVDVQWRAPDGSSFVEALGRATLPGASVELAVCVTERAPRQDGMPVEPFLVSGRSQRVPSRLANATSRVEENRASAGNSFARLALDRPLPLYASAWADGVLLAVVEIEPAQREVVFTTPVEGLEELLGRVSLCVHDAETGAVVPDAQVHLRARVDGAGPIELGGAACITDAPCRPIWTEVSVRAEGYATHDEWVLVRSGLVTDLGDVRLARPVRVDARVVDAQGKAVAGVDFRLERIEPYEKLRIVGQGRVVTSNTQGEMSMPALGRERFVLRSIDDAWAATPVLVDTTVGSATEVVVHVVPSVGVGFELDSLPARGTIALVETHDGLVVQDALVVERAWTMRLAPGAYRVSFVEHFTTTTAVPLSVGSEPFVFSIAR